MTMKSIDTSVSMLSVSLLTSAHIDQHTLQLMQLITAAIVTKEPQKSILETKKNIIMMYK